MGMGWATELRKGFQALQAGGTPRVSFAAQDDPIGELGRAFNALAADLEQSPQASLGREQAHRLRNRLAGILAAVELLGESGELTGEEQSALRQVVAEARQLDHRLSPA